MNAIGLEAVMIYREDGVQRFPLRQVNQSRIGEIHGPIGIAGHKSMQRRQVGIRDRGKNQVS